jgi:DNA polymerase III subunit epsilon
MNYSLTETMPGEAMPNSDLESMARLLEESGDYQVLRRQTKKDRYHADDGGDKKIGVFLDVETTGLVHGSDKIIELAMVPFEFTADGRIYRILDAFRALEDPGISIPPEIVALTGITDADVAGQRIDDDSVERILGQANLVIAHNAGFDRRFCERRFPSFVPKAWACSLTQIPWKQEGVANSKLEYLAYQYGFFYQKHRAVSDCLAAIHLLAGKLPTSGQSVLKVLLDNARKQAIRIWALNSPFDAKEILKSRGYSWPGDGGRIRAWYIDVDKDLFQTELDYLFAEVFKRKVELPTEPVNCFKRFSDRV